MPSRYRYYALTSLVYTLDNPLTVVRIGGAFEECLNAELEWERSDLMYGITSGHENYDAVEISEDDAKRIEQTLARRVAEKLERDGH